MMRDLTPPLDRETKLKRIRMRAWRRGMKEMDLLLGGFVDAKGASLADADLDTLEQVMTRPDQLLYDWVSGRTPDGPPDASAEERAIIAQVASHADEIAT